jgi:nucleoside-diphosphate-sugar epimerase
MQTILGAGGSIGSLLAKELYQFTKDIRLVSRNPKLVNESDQLFKADLSEPSMVDKAIEGSEIVYVTIAFEYKLSVWEQKWLPFMQSVVNSCIKYNCKLVFFDNIYMYDRNFLYNMTESTPINPSSKKGVIRKQVSDLVIESMKKGELKAIIARSADFIGPRNNILVEAVYKSFAKGKKAGWLLDVTKIHTFTYVADAAKATALLGNTPDAYNQVWHLPTDNTPLTAEDWIELFANELGVEAKYNVMPKFLLNLFSIFIPIYKELNEMSYQLDRDYLFNSDKFCNTFNFIPTSPIESVRQTVELLKRSD